jgi:hypothetical protein
MLTAGRVSMVGTYDELIEKPEFSDFVGQGMQQDTQSQTERTGKLSCLYLM